MSSQQTPKPTFSTNAAIRALASVAVCPGEKASGKLSYVWECSLAGLSSTSVDPRYFKASAYTFTANRDYLVSVLVVDNFGYNNTAEVVVQVGTSDLVAAIDGGDRTVGISDTLTLDASFSYDPDVGNDDGGAGQPRGVERRGRREAAAVGRAAPPPLLTCSNLVFSSFKSAIEAIITGGRTSSFANTVVPRWFVCLRNFTCLRYISTEFNTVEFMTLVIKSSLNP